LLNNIPSLLGAEGSVKYSDNLIIIMHQWQDNSNPHTHYLVQSFKKKFILWNYVHKIRTGTDKKWNKNGIWIIDFTVVNIFVWN